MSAVINADSQQVWRALTDAREVVSWDDQVVGSVDVPTSYPQAGQHVRWRYKLGSVQLVLHDRPQEVVPLERLRTNLSVGSMRFEQTYSLQPEPGDPPKTRLGIRLVASNSVPVIGTVVDRFEVRRMAVDRIDAALRAIQKWCENEH